MQILTPNVGAAAATSREGLGLAGGRANCLWFKVFEQFVAMRVKRSRASPAEVPIEAVGATTWLRRAPEEEATVAKTKQEADDETKQLLTQPQAFELRQQCEDYNLSGLFGAEAIAYELPFDQADKAREVSCGDVAAPRLSSDSGAAEPLLRDGVLASEAPDADTLLGVGGDGGSELEVHRGFGVGVRGLTLS